MPKAVNVSVRLKTIPGEAENKNSNSQHMFFKISDVEEVANVKIRCSAITLSQGILYAM